MVRSMRTRLDAYLAGDFTIPANDRFGFAVQPDSDPKQGVTVSWTVPPELCNSAGNLQGGMLGAFADSAMGGACAAHLPADMYPALVEMKISFLRPARSGSTIQARARVIKPGKRLLFVEAEITDDSGELLAKVTGTEVPAKP
jgi:uncharacterized protein (TIGR00369 family)